MINKHGYKNIYIRKYFSRAPRLQLILAYRIIWQCSHLFPRTLPTRALYDWVMFNINNLRVISHVIQSRTFEGFTSKTLRRFTKQLNSLFIYKLICILIKQRLYIYVLCVFHVSVLQKTKSHFQDYNCSTQNSTTRDPSPSVDVIEAGSRALGLLLVLVHF